MGGDIEATGIGSDGTGIDVGLEAMRKMKTRGRSAESDR